MQENYGCDLDACPGGYDGLHPNALGKNNPKYIHCFINRSSVKKSNFENNSRGLHQIQESTRLHRPSHVRCSMTFRLEIVNLLSQPKFQLDHSLSQPILKQFRLRKVSRSSGIPSMGPMDMNLIPYSWAPARGPNSMSTPTAGTQGPRMGGNTSSGFVRNTVIQRQIGRILFLSSTAHRNSRRHLT